MAFVRLLWYSRHDASPQYRRKEIAAGSNLVPAGKEAFMPTTKLQLGNIQGNSIGGFSKDFQTNLFLKFTNAANGRAWIQEISGEIAGSSSADVLDFNRQFAALTKQGVQRPEELISAVWVNLAFS